MLLTKIKNVALAVFGATTLGLAGACYGLYQLNEATRSSWEQHVTEIVADSHIVTMAAERKAHSKEVADLQALLMRERALRLEAQTQERVAARKVVDAVKLIQELSDDSGCLDRPVNDDLIGVFLVEADGADSPRRDHEDTHR